MHFEQNFTHGKPTRKPHTAASLDAKTHVNLSRQLDAATAERDTIYMDYIRNLEDQILVEWKEHKREVGDLKRNLEILIMRHDALTTECINLQRDVSKGKRRFEGLKRLLEQTTGVPEL